MNHDLLIAAADDAYEAVRTINHFSCGVLPAPTVYAVLGNLKCVGHMLPQALRQLGDGLAASLCEYDVYDAHGVAPALSVTTAHAYLADSAEHARDLGLLLEAAQSAISQQGHHGVAKSRR